MELLPIAREELLTSRMSVDEVLSRANVKDGPTLWLVMDDEKSEALAGVLSPFELM